MGPARGPPGGGPRGAQARAAHQPRDLRAAHRIAIRSPSSRRRRRTDFRTSSPCGTADGRVALRLLPRHAGGDGLRPRRRRRGPTSSCRPAATPTSPTSASSPRPSASSSSTPTTSTRRCRPRGSGTSSASRRAWSSLVVPTASGRRRTAPRRWPTVRSYREWMARYAAMRLIEVWYSRITEADISRALRSRRSQSGRTPRRERASWTRSSQGTGTRRAQALRAKLTQVVDGRRVIVGRPARRPARRDPRRRRSPRPSPFEDYRATMAESRREFLERYRFVGLRAQGRGRRQRRDALLRHRARGARRERPVDPPGQGGDRVRPRAVRAGQPAHEPRRAGRRRASG